MCFLFRGHYVVKVPTISSVTWNLVITFIYTGQVRVLASEKEALVSAAGTLGLTDLVNLCEAVNRNPIDVVSTLVGGEGKSFRFSCNNCVLLPCDVTSLMNSFVFIYRECGGKHGNPVVVCSIQRITELVTKPKCRRVNR